METTKEQKRSKAHSVLKLALLLSAATLIGTIVLVILSKAAGIEILEAMATDLLGGRSSSGSSTTIFVIAMLLFMLTMAVAQGIYAQKIGELAAAHRDEEEYQPLKRARNGAYVQLAALVLLMLTPLLAKGLLYTESVILMLIVLISPWIVAIVGTIMMRKGFKSLYFCDSTTGIRSEGAEDLRYTATCQLRLLFMPLVFLLFSILMTVLLLNSIKATWDGGGFYAMSLDQLFQSIRDFKGRGGSTISTIRTFYYIDAIAIAVFMFFTLVWYFFTLVKPITGWNRFMKGLTAEENEAEAESSARGNRIADQLERLRNWYYYVAAGVIVVLMFLPLFKGAKKNHRDDDRSDRQEAVEKQYNRAKAKPSSDKVTGYYTDHDQETGDVIIFAVRGDETTNTGIKVGSYYCNISDQHDYDGDGNMDALVAWTMGGAYPGNMFIVYYDKVLAKFNRTEDFEPDCRPELVDGVWTILYNTTTEKKRYSFDRGRLVTIEHETVDAGDADRRITIETVFGDDMEAGATKEYAVDLNDDGIDETFSFTVSYYRWGAIMYSDGFTSDGTAYDLPGQGTLVVLKNKTQGWHDVMWENEDLDEHYLFRWTGNGYEEVSL